MHNKYIQTLYPITQRKQKKFPRYLKACQTSKKFAQAYSFKKMYLFIQNKINSKYLDDICNQEKNR